MATFTYSLGSPCNVGGEAIYSAAAGAVYMDGEHVASVVQVVTLAGLTAWRVYDYDEPLKGLLEAFFMKEPIYGFSPGEVTFSRPFF